MKQKLWELHVLIGSRMFAADRPQDAEARAEMMDQLIRKFAADNNITYVELALEYTIYVLSGRYLDTQATALLAEIEKAEKAGRLGVDIDVEQFKQVCDDIAKNTAMSGIQVGKAMAVLKMVSMPKHPEKPLRDMPNFFPN